MGDLKTAKNRGSNTGAGTATSEQASEGLASAAFPMRLLNQAVQAVPAVKYALGVAGVTAVVALVGALRIGFAEALFGTLATFVFMVLLVIFARLVRAPSQALTLPVTVMMWSFMLLAIASAVLTSTAVFFGWPREFRDLAGGVQPAAVLAYSGAPPPLDTVLARRSPPVIATTPAQGLLELGFEILARHSNSDHFALLNEGAELATGVDDFCIVINPHSGGYLYVVLQDASGRIQWLYPSNQVSAFSSGTNPVAGGKAVTIPAANDKVFFLDATTGVETIVVAFSASPWRELEAALMAAAGSNQPRAGPADGLAALAAMRGVGGVRQIQVPVTALAGEKSLGGRFYRLPVPLAVNQADGNFLVLRRSFKHVAKP